MIASLLLPFLSLEKAPGPAAQLDGTLVAYSLESSCGSSCFLSLLAKARLLLRLDPIENMPRESVCALFAGNLSRSIFVTV